MKFKIVCPFFFPSFNALHLLVREFPEYWWGLLLGAFVSVVDLYQSTTPLESIMLRCRRSDEWLSSSSLPSRRIIDDELLLMLQASS
jgi:hypothetical protein